MKARRPWITEQQIKERLEMATEELKFMKPSTEALSRGVDSLNSGEKIKARIRMLMDEPGEWAVVAWGYEKASVPSKASDIRTNKRNGFLPKGLNMSDIFVAYDTTDDPEIKSAVFVMVKRRTHK